ncbi:PAS domain S-box protein [Christiangramia aquimixticola]|uniref:PAS domain S-box protein n=1 Tax=Christiangramia aquimixticola TaxID=1697558 RepID=UPI003AA7B429
MTSKTSLSVSEAVFVLNFSNGVTAFDKNAIKFFEEQFNVKIGQGFTLFDIFNADLATRLNEKLVFCKKGKFQILAWNEKESVKEFRFYISPIVQEDQTISSVSISVELNNSQEALLQNIKIEKELEYSKQFYSNLFNNNPDAVFAFDLEGNFINVNSQSATLAETSTEELIKMHFLPFIPDEDKEKVLEKFSSSLNGKSPKYETRFISTKGTRKILEINNIPIRFKGEIIGVYGIAKDVTKQREIENNIIAERQMLKAIIDNIPDYIFVNDKDHKSILANKKFFNKILGKDIDQGTSGYSPLDYYDLEKAKEIIVDNEAVIKTGIPVINRPDLIVNNEGKEEMVLLTKVPLKDCEDNIIGLIGIARDITETYLNNKKKDLIFKTIKAFGDKPTFKEATIKALRTFCTELGYDYAEAYKVSVNNTKLIRTCNWPILNDNTKNSEEKVLYERGEGLPGRVWQNAEIEIRRSREGSLLNEMQIEDPSQIKTVVGIPITFEGKLISVFCFGSYKHNKEIKKGVLNDVSIQVASAIERKRSQEQLNNFFSYSPNLIAILGLDGFIKKVNPSFERKFEYPESEILSQPFLDFIHPDDLQKTFEAMETVSIAGSDFEIRCRKKDGSYLWISWRFSRFFETENVVFVYGTDITELKDHENLIKDNAKRFKALVQEGSDHISIMDRDYNYLYNSPAVKSIFGLTAGEMNKTNFRDHLIPVDEKKINEDLLLLSKSKRLQLPSYRITNKTGDIRWIETIVTDLTDDPAIDGIVMNSRDITEFISQERKLLESLKRYDIVAKATSDIITDFNIKDRIIQVSESATEVFGFDKVESYPIEWWNEHIHPEDHDFVREAAQSMVLRGNQNLTVEYRFRCADGTYKHILDRSYLISDKSGKPQRIIGSMQDITEMKRYLIEIENHNKRLREIGWTQSHLVRAPLAKVMGLVDLLLNYKNDLENIDEILEKVLNSANELDKIIRHIAVQTEKEI